MKYWLAWVTYSFHWDEVRHCDGQPQQGRNVWHGEEFPKNPKGRACESMLDMEKWKPTHLSQPSLSLLSSYNSQSPNPPSVGLNVHSCLAPSSQAMLPSKTALDRGIFFPTHTSTLETFWGSSLLSLYPSGFHSSWSYSLLVCWWRNLCLCASVTKCYLYAFTLSLESLFFFFFNWAFIQARVANGRSFEHRRSPGRFWVGRPLASFASHCVGGFFLYLRPGFLSGVDYCPSQLEEAKIAKRNKANITSFPNRESW